MQRIVDASQQPRSLETILAHSTNKESCNREFVGVLLAVRSVNGRTFASKAPLNEGNRRIWNTIAVE